jgi:2-oxoglutarate dehydrogenase E2 component (dihydrolipoamide succinyltransferase)
MSTTVTMPQLGETVTEGTILRWAKQPGDTISEDEVLLEISTDKVDTEVPSPASGTVLEILVPEGETVAVGTELARIGEAGEAGGAAPAPAAEQPEPPGQEPEPQPDPPQAPQAQAPQAQEPRAQAPQAQAPQAQAPQAQAQQQTEPEAAPSPPQDPPPQPSNGRKGGLGRGLDSLMDEAASKAGPVAAAGDVGLLSPVVRKLASEHGIDLSQVNGTGRGGRITRRDVEDFIESGAPAAAPAAAAEPSAAPQPQPAEQPAQQPAPQAQPAQPEPAPAQQPAAAAQPEPEPAEQPAAAPAAEAQPAPAVGRGDEVIELDRMRVRIAENMVRAKQTAAHVWTSVEVDFEQVERVRQKHKAAFKEREGFSLTYLPFIARATIDALAEYPVVNSSFFLEKRQRIQHSSVNLGIAVDLDQGGLVVMKVTGADGLRMRGIAREVRRIAEKARGGSLEPDDLSGSTFTITNPGPFGSFMSAPIINIPNVAILSTDTVAKRPVVITDKDGNDAIAIHHVGYLGLTWDHRAFDGSTAVLFLRHIKQNLESWDWEQELA